MGVEKVAFANVFSAVGLRGRVFFSVRLSAGWLNRRYRLVEEAYQALDVLCRCGQEELLAHEPQSPQTQAPQSDLILQFREQGFHLLSLPLGCSELWRVDQLPRTLSGWFVLVDDKARKAALVHCGRSEHGPHFLRVPM